VIAHFDNGAIHAIERAVSAPGPGAYWARHAWLPAGIAENVRLQVDDGRFTAVTPGEAPALGDVQLPGVVLPGFANTHSHAFHRALRGRTHHEGGTFWTWRNAMYTIAERLTPDTYYTLARAVYAEMALAGVTVVGEFHYVHHRPDGTPYPDPNAMGEALMRAAADAGIRLTLLDTCYLAGGLGETGHVPLDRRQRRFGDDGVAAWADRFAALADRPGVRIGAAIHSVRAVPAHALPTVVAAAAGRPLHVHLSEQPAENQQCVEFYGVTPTELLRRAQALGPHTTAVHATHLTPADVTAIAAAGAAVSLCPTTERDLADGIGPAGALAAAGVRLVLGTDQHAMVDLLEEARAVELNERLATGRRGTFAPADLLHLLSGHDTLGWPDAGTIAVGQRADLVELDPRSIRTAGTDPAQILFAAGTPDVRTVVVDGQPVVDGGRHRLGDVGALLAGAIASVTSQAVTTQGSETR